MSKKSKAMTVSQFHKALGKLIEQGYGRRYVAVEKTSFRDDREADGCVILNVFGIEMVAVEQADAELWYRDKLEAALEVVT